MSAQLSKARSALSGPNKRADDAIIAARAALAVDETSVEAMVLLAHGNYVKGYYDQAEEVLRKASKRGGANNKRLHFLLGLVYEKTDRPDDAFAAFDRAVVIDGNYQSALLNLGVHYLRNKRYDKAVEVYERLTGDLGYNKATAWANLGSAFRGQSAGFQATDLARRNELVLKAERTYKRALSVDRQFAGAYYNLGLLYLDSDPFPTSSGDLDRLTRLKRASTYFDEYRRVPGADQKLAETQIAVAQKLYDREENLRKKAAEREKKRAEKERKRKEREAKGQSGDDGFE